MTYTIDITNENGERQRITADSAAIIYSHDNGEVCVNRDHLHTLRLDDNDVISPYYNKIIKGLLDRYSHYLYLSSAMDVCVMVDDAWKPPKDAAKNAMWKADIVKASKDLRLLLGYEYVLKLRQYWVDRWSGAQLTAAIMSQLLRIDWNGSITKYSEDVTSRLVSMFGSGYLDDTFVDIPNLLGSPEPITLHDFPRADKQITVDELQEVTA